MGDSREPLVAAVKRARGGLDRRIALGILDKIKASKQIAILKPLEIMDRILQ